MKEILAQKPLGIHFSGHGIENKEETVGKYHFLHKNEGDFLLLETNDCDS